MAKDSKIIVLMGGFSNEREVALRSGKKVYEALTKLGYTNLELFDIETQASMQELIEKHQANNYDLAFLTTHGKFGEDGCLQGFLEMINLPYTGAKVMQSAIGMNKKATKEILKANSLPVLAACGKDIDSLVENEYIIKPNCEGSSVGVIKFDSKKDLVSHIVRNNIDLREFVVERFVRGTEVTASILEYDAQANNLNIDMNSCFSVGKLISLPLLELRPKNEFYDYEAKYTAGMTEFIVPSSLGENLQTKIHQIAIEAYQALGLNGLARVDFIVDEASKEPYILEVNTLPGMTELSDSPASALAANISYEELVDIIVSSSLSAVNSTLH